MTAREAAVYAIRSTHAFDGTRFLPGGATVLVAGERIVGVETFAHRLPEDIEVLEHDGTMLPGLIDCHTHLVADCSVGGLERAETMTDDELDATIIRSLRAHLAAGVTTVRDLGDVAYRTVTFAGSGGLPRVVAAGPPVTTPGGHCHFLGGVVPDLDEASLRSAVDEHVEGGVDVIKVMASGGFATPGSDQLGAQFTTDQLAVLVDQAHRAGFPLVTHAHSLLAIQNSLAARVDGIEHFSGLSATPGVRLDDSVLDDAADQGTFVDLTMGNDRALHHLLREVPPTLAALMAHFGAATFDEFYGMRMAQLAQMREHGVRVVTGVDSGMAPPKGHGNLWRAVAEMVEAGYTTTEALTSATSLAAEACGLARDTGRLLAGHTADILLVDGDLSHQVTTLRAPRHVFVRGTTSQTLDVGHDGEPGAT